MKSQATFDAARVGFCATRVPTGIVNRLNKETNAAVADSVMKARLADLGSESLSMAPDAFGKLLTGEAEKWGNLIRTAHLKPA